MEQATIATATNSKNYVYVREKAIRCVTIIVYNYNCMHTILYSCVVYVHATHYACVRFYPYKYKYFFESFGLGHDISL